MSRLSPHAVCAQPFVASCQAGAAYSVLQPPPLAKSDWPRNRAVSPACPLLFHETSAARVPSSLSCSVVPAVATTPGNDAGVDGALSDGTPLT